MRPVSGRTARGAVQYDDFVSSVQARGARPRDVLRVLAQRITAGKAEDLRAQLRGDSCGPPNRAVQCEVTGSKEMEEEM